MDCQCLYAFFEVCKQPCTEISYGQKDTVALQTQKAMMKHVLEGNMRCNAHLGQIMNKILLWKPDEQLVTLTCKLNA